MMNDKISTSQARLNNRIFSDKLSTEFLSNKNCAKTVKAGNT